MPGLGFALGVISSAYLHRGLGIALLHSFQEFLPAPLVRCVWKALPTVGGVVTQLLAWAWANQALGMAKLLITVSESSRSSLCGVPWSEGTTNLILQMSKTTGWDFCLGINPTKLRVLVASNLSPVLYHSQFPND